MRITDDYVFFYGSVFSNWFECKLIWRGIEFNCAEQAMMWAKGMVFGDKESQAKILATDDPRKQKALGRKIKNFDLEVWHEVCVDLVTDICYAKFSQELSLGLCLIQHGYGRNFVEASPYDRIWGVGLSEDDNRILDPKNWMGRNYLGICLDRVCERLTKELTYLS